MIHLPNSISQSEMFAAIPEALKLGFLDFISHDGLLRKLPHGIQSSTYYCSLLENAQLLLTFLNISHPSPSIDP